MASIVGPLALAGMRQHMRGNEPGTSRAQRAFWRSIASAMSDSDIRAMVSAGALTANAENALRSRLALWVSETLEPRWRSSLRSGARLVDSGFELLSPQSINSWTANRTSGFVTGQSQQQREALNTAIQRMIQSRTPQSTLESVLRATAGLTQRQSASLQKQIEAQRAADVAEEQIQRNARKVADRMQASRARIIARTELAAAYNGGTQGAIEQGVRDGLFVNVQKVWRVQSGADCKICKPVNGESVALTDTFDNGFSAPPAHPGCRCVLLYEVS